MLGKQSRSLILAAVTAIGLCGGCSEMLRSAKFSVDSGAAVTGQPYFLPRGLIPISILVRVPVTGFVPGIQMPGGAAAVTAPTPTVSVTNTVSMVPAPSPDPSNPPANQLSVRVGSPRFVADPSAMLLLEYHESAFSDDHFDIKVDQNGLLQTSDLTSHDRSGDATVKLAELIGQVASLGATFSPPRIVGSPRAPLVAQVGKCLPSATGLDFLLDAALLFQTTAIGVDGKVRDATEPERRATLTDQLPTGATVTFDQVSAFGRANERATIAFTNELAGLKIVVVAIDSTMAAGVDQKADSSSHSGLVFRALKRYWVTASYEAPQGSEGNCPAFRNSGAFMLPDPETVYRVDVARAPLVTKHVILTVQDGMLMGQTVDKPSEVLAGVTLPVEVLKTIVSIPAGLLTLHVQQVTAQANLTQAEANLLTQELALIRAREALAAPPPTLPTQ